MKATLGNLTYFEIEPMYSMMYLKQIQNLNGLHLKIANLKKDGILE